ncbi:hypothetical protein [Chromobacterium haemolyticum]|uniref:hypothetical protein n=1 Tax=Chromobacterium haemolyticum TaxID=394935 RepID=UPI00307F577F
MSIAAHRRRMWIRAALNKLARQARAFPLEQTQMDEADVQAWRRMNPGAPINQQPPSQQK